jgi:hypothetical protein
MGSGSLKRFLPFLSQKRALRASTTPLHFASPERQSKFARILNPGIFFQGQG